MMQVNGCITRGETLSIESFLKWSLNNVLKDLPPDFEEVHLVILVPFGAI